MRFFMDKAKPQSRKEDVCSRGDAEVSYAADAACFCLEQEEEGIRSPRDQTPPRLRANPIQTLRAIAALRELKPEPGTA